MCGSTWPLSSVGYVLVLLATLEIDSPHVSAIKRRISEQQARQVSYLVSYLPFSPGASSAVAGGASPAPARERTRGVRVGSNSEQTELRSIPVRPARRRFKRMSRNGSPANWHTRERP